MQHAGTHVGFNQHAEVELVLVAPDEGVVGEFEFLGGASASVFLFFGAAIAGEVDAIEPICMHRYATKVFLRGKNTCFKQVSVHQTDTTSKRSPLCSI